MLFQKSRAISDEHKVNLSAKKSDRPSCITCERKCGRFICSISVH